MFTRDHSLLLHVDNSCVQNDSNRTVDQHVFGSRLNHVESIMSYVPSIYPQILQHGWFLLSIDMS